MAFHLLFVVVLNGTKVSNVAENNDFLSELWTNFREKDCKIGEQVTIKTEQLELYNNEADYKFGKFGEAFVKAELYDGDSNFKKNLPTFVKQEGEETRDQSVPNYDGIKNIRSEVGIGHGAGTNHDEGNDTKCRDTQTNEKWEKIVKNFDKIKEKLIGGSKIIKRQDIENEIAKKMGTNRTTIYRWKSKLKLTQKQYYYSDKEKSDLVKQFYELKEEYIRRGDGSLLTGNLLDKKVAQKLGICLRSIFNWKRQLGLSSTVPGRKRFSNKEKRKIVRQFIELKERNWNKMGDKTWIEKEEKVARALGVHRATIKKWKCHLGISTSAAYHSLTSDEDSVDVGESGTQSSEEDVDQNDGHFSDIASSSMELPKKDKLAYENEFSTNDWNKQTNDGREKIVKKFDKMKENLIEKRSKLCIRLEIENEIARKLGTTRALIYKWKKMVENSQKTIYYSEKEKRELIKQFYEMKKKKIRENKASNKRKIEDEVLQQLDISRRRIYRWKKELGQIKSIKRYNDEEKRKIVKQFFELKKRNFEVEENIARRLGVHRMTIYKWRRELIGN